MPVGDELDLENRDPNDMNRHVQVEFVDVIGEPEGAYSPDCIFTCTYRCFKGTKNCCYILMVALLGIPLSILWGIQFAFISFCNIWFMTPLRRIYSIYMLFCSGIVETCCDCICGNYCYAAGRVFSRMKMTIQRD